MRSVRIFSYTDFMDFPEPVAIADRANNVINATLNRFNKKCDHPWIKITESKTGEFHCHVCGEYIAYRRSGAV